MPEGVDASGSRTTPREGAEYTAAPHARHRTTSGTRRSIFFALAAIWGFAVGVIGLLAALSAAGQHVQPGPAALSGLLLAFFVAVAGGLVMTAAYRESKRRARK
jgi:uncharacterized membrane-anchored protein